MTSKDKLVPLLKGLKVDQNEILHLLKDQDWLTVAKILGFSIANYDKLLLSGRMLIHDLIEKTPSTVEAYIAAFKHKLQPPVYEYMLSHLEELQRVTDKRSSNDYKHDFSSASSLIKNYSAKTKSDGPSYEAPRFICMRIAVGLYHKKGMKEIVTCFKDLCDHWYVYASPTIFNAGFKKGYLSSCFLLTMDDDSESILNNGIHDSAIISRSNGGVGLDATRLRHSEIDGGGHSKGLVPVIYVLNANKRLWDQRGKRDAAFTIYIRPHHIDTFEFCDVTLKTGDIYTRAHDINTALWTPWIFWERVKRNENWTLFCPAKTKLLNDCYGLEFEKHYVEYEKDFSIKQRRTVKARDLLKHIIQTQRKTGNPYLLNGDAANFKSNQRNLGYIRSSNLCLEVMEYSSTTEIPSCNLSSLSLRKFIKKGFNNSKECDFDKLAEITRKVVNNLNRVIDVNCYPLESIKPTNLKNRPIGLGVSGFAELLHELDLPFCSLDSIKEIHPDTKILNKKIFACIYFNAMIQSIELSIEEGPYSTFQGSPLSEGKFQFTLWADEYDMLNDLGRIDHRIRKKEDDIPIDPKEWDQKHTILSNGHVVENNWDSLREAVLQFGVRNSLLIALMPTATSAQILRNCESTEAHMSCIYSRKVIKSNYPVVNRYLVWDLEALGLWNRNTVDLIQSDNGSIGKLPQFVKANPTLYPEFDGFSDNYNRLKYLTYKYKTMWELDTRIFLQLAADRGRYVCQSQSTNIYFADPSDAQLIACHLFAYGLGLKTLNYYLRELPATDPIKFTVDANIAKFVKDINFEINEEDEGEDPKEAELKGQNSKGKEEVEIITLSRKENKKIKCTEDVCMSCSS